MQYATKITADRIFLCGKDFFFVVKIVIIFLRVNGRVAKQPAN